MAAKEVRFSVDARDKEKRLDKTTDKLFPEG